MRRLCGENAPHEGDNMSETLLHYLFDDAAYVGIHKNAKGRITLVINNGEGSLRTSCSKKGLTWTDKLMECRNRLSETLERQAP
jgi:hypothetical protein